MKFKKTMYPFICLIFLIQYCAAQSALFQGLGDLPGGEFKSSAIKVSADGSVVAGTGMTESGQQAFRWMPSTGMISLGNLPDTSFKESWTIAVSADGTIIVGSGDPGSGGWNDYRGFIWTPDSGMKNFGRLDSASRYEVFSISADGSVIIGDGGAQAFRWTKENGIEGLGILPGKTNSRAIDISDDGSVIIGQSYSLPAWNDEDGFIWTQSGGMKSMASLTGGKYCMLLTISPDGSVIAGTTFSSSTYPAFFWSESKGFINIGHLPGKNTTHPTDMTASGKIIVGGSFSGPASGDAFIWDSTKGMRKLQTVLQTEYGLDLTGWTLQNASGITPDGNVIVGHGINPSGKQEAFRVVLDTLSTGVNEKSKSGIRSYELNQNYPNPFNPSTTIKYSLAKSSHINLTIHNLLGQKIKTLVSCFKSAGEHSIVWDATNDKSLQVSTGIYFYKLGTNEMSVQKKMILIR